MVMNKKGILKILEAIIAIIIVLGFVISITPIKQKDNSKIPPNLEQTTNSVLKEVQNNPKFRQCVINNNASCINTYIDYLSFPVEAHPWEYAIEICNINYNATVLSCDYYPKITESDLSKQNKKFIDTALPKDKDVYIRDITLTVPDITGPDINGSIGTYNVLTIHAWSKQ